jgi:hypothetical protein
LDGAGADRYEEAAAGETLARALQLTGGVDLVLGSLAVLPGAQRTPARKTMFKSNPERVQVGEWRYEAAGGGRLLAAHVVGGVTIAETTLPPEAAGAHVAAALGQHVRAYGSSVTPAVQATLAGLAVASGG